MNLSHTTFCLLHRSICGVLLTACSLQAQTYVNINATGANTGTSWENAYTDLQTAFDEGQSSNIWVARGVYKPNGTDRTTTFSLPSGKTIYGGFEGDETHVNQRDPNPLTNGCVLSGDIGVEGDDSDNSYHVLSVTGINSNVKIEGFTVTGGNANGGGTDQNIGGGVIIQDNFSFVYFASMRFIGNQASNGGGAMYVHGSTALIHTSQFLANRAGNRGGAIYFYYEGRVQLYNSAFVGNEVYNASSAGGAMYAYGKNSYDNEYTEGVFWIYNCTYTANAAVSDGGAIANWGPSSSQSASTRLVNCIAWDNTASTDPNVDPPLTDQSVNNYIGVDPDFRFAPDSGDGDWLTLEDNYYGDLRLHESSSLIDAFEYYYMGTDYTDLDNDLSTSDSLPYDLAFRPRVNNTMEPGAYEYYDPIFFVDQSVAEPGDGSSWEKAFQELSEALEYSREGDQFWVAEGIYKPGTERSDTFTVNPGVTVFGGFPAGGGRRGFEARDYNPLTNNTVLSGDLNGDDTTGFSNRSDNSYHVVSFIHGFDDPWLDGFTIHGGNANGSGNHQNGGGIYSAYSSSSQPRLANLFITDNRADNQGGGMFAGGYIKLLNSQVRNNEAALGGGMSLSNNYSNITNVLVADNNATSQGGGVYMLNAYAQMNNITVAHNSAPAGSAFYGEIASENSLFNSIIWGNTGSTNAVENVPFILGASHNLNQDDGAEDPLLDPTTFELSVGSPAIDAGSNIRRGIDWADTDHDGNFSEEIPTDGFGFWRLDGAFVDIGAYEYQHPLSGLDNTRFTESWEIGLGDGDIETFLPQPWICTDEDLNIVWRPGPSAEGQRFNQTTPLPAPAHGQHVLYIAADETFVYRFAGVELANDTLYELNAAIGYDLLVDSDGWSLELWIDSDEDGNFEPDTDDAQLASLTRHSAGANNPDEGLWAPNRLSYVYNAAQHAAFLGKPIIVALTNREADTTAYFDNVSFAVTTEATLAATTPASKSVGNAIDAPIVMSFNDDISADTINTGSMLVSGSISGQISGSISIDGNEITFTPNAPLELGETISVTFTDAAKSSGNASLAGNDFTFQTELAPEVDWFARLNHQRPDSIIGNFVDAATGDFRPAISLIDVQGARGLGFPISYHSLFTSTIGEVGYAWTHAYEIRLTGDPNGEVYLRWDNTRRNTFHYRGPGTPYFSDEPSMIDYQLVRQDDGSWLLSTPSKIHYEFDANGRLNRVGNAVFQWLQLHYTNGMLTRIEEPIAEKSIFLTYNEDGFIETVSDDIQRQVTLSYDDEGRLVGVSDPMLFGEGLIGDSIGAPKSIPDGGAPLTHNMVVNTMGAVGKLRIETGLLTAGADMTDVTITLFAPSGKSVVIHDQEAHGYDFSGEIIDGFDGESLAGTWQLQIQDQAGSGSSFLLDWQMSYTGSSNTTQFIYEDGAFPAAGRISQATDLFGHQLYANTYDDSGRVLTQDDGLTTNQMVTLSYTPNGDALTTVYSDRLGNDFTLAYNDARFLTKLIDSRGAITEYELNSVGDRISMTNPLGWTWLFEYDEFGNLTKMTNPYGAVYPFAYDDNGNVIDINDGKTTLEYDELNNAISLKHPSGNVRANEYDPTSQLSETRDFRFDDDDATLSETTYVLWNGSIGRERTMTLPDGATIVTIYDAIGRVIETTNTNDQTNTTEFTQTGQVASTTDPLGYQEFFAYDYRGRMISKIDKNGNVSTFSYDGNDNMVQRVEYLDESTPLITTIQYDGEDRPTVSTDPAGNSTTRVYDAMGNTVKTIDAEGRYTLTRYDLNGDETERYDQNGKLILRTTYDRLGLPEYELDSDGFETYFTYSGLQTPTAAYTQGKIQAGSYTQNSDEVAISGPGGSRTIRSTYGVSQIRNPADTRTSFYFDANGRVTSAITYGSQNLETRWEYDNSGNMTQIERPSARNIRYRYDELGRIGSIEPSNGAKGRAYEYDPKGNLLTVTQTTPFDFNPLPDEVISHEYDALDRLVSYTDSGGNKIRFQYDLAGRVSLIVYPDNKTVAYAYNDAGQLISVTDWAARRTSYAYNDIGRVSRIDFPNGAYREILYNNSGGITKRYDREPDGAVIVGYEYVRNLPTELAAEVPLHEEAPYLPADVTMTYDGHDRLLTYNGESVEVSMDGNMTTPPASLGLGTLEFDSLNRLITQNYTNTFEYDPADRLINWNINGESTDFIVHPGGGLGQTLVKVDEDGTRTNYVYGIGLIYQETEGATRTFHYDTRGSTAALSDDSGATVGRISYGPWGEIANRTGDTDTVFLYCGLYGVMTSPQGLVNMRFRWYLPELKRFISADAHRGNIFRADSMNRFAYANNNPITRIDPNGELAFLAPLVGATVGAVVGATTTLVVDFIDDGQINTPWQEYAGAAIGGAVTGAILTVNPTLLFTAGAAGAFSESLFVGITDPETDLTLQGLATDTLIGGALGKIGPAGKKAGKSVKTAVFGAGKKSFNMAKRRAVSGWGDILALEAKESLKEVFKGVGKKVAGRVVVNSVIDGFAGDPTGIDAPGGGVGDGGSGGGLPPGNASVFLRTINEPQQGVTGIYGADLHWSIYVEALQRAGRPVPSHPNQTVDNF
ncbi:RHS repeat-associated core domain-containing protein [Cerasicoccus maritimus]|uniref:RHS repeat-associated core domain-containing protein n=1 Tax=Cerasicoccus maritimus TaxID=490089 RepID=UPI002852494B|nr:RHS repeat-associated core domain-containing protein [Cerasicoccus maritimus]